MNFTSFEYYTCIKTLQTLFRLNQVMTYEADSLATLMFYYVTSDDVALVSYDVSYNNGSIIEEQEMYEQL